MAFRVLPLMPAGRTVGRGDIQYRAARHPDDGEPVATDRSVELFRNECVGDGQVVVREYKDLVPPGPVFQHLVVAGGDTDLVVLEELEGPLAERDERAIEVGILFPTPRA